MVLLLVCKVTVYSVAINFAGHTYICNLKDIQKGRISKEGRLN